MDNLGNNISEVTVSRRIFLTDYKILREMAFKQESNITKILNDVYLFIKPKIEQKGVEFLPEINDKSSSNTHKSVRISIDFNDFLNEVSNKSGGISAKKLLSSCVHFYSDNSQ